MEVVPGRRNVRLNTSGTGGRRLQRRAVGAWQGADRCPTVGLARPVLRGLAPGLAIGLAGLGWWPEAATPARAQERGAPAATAGGDRRTALNFAHKLLRDRRYDLAAAEYEAYLKDAPAGPDTAEARYGLATAQLFLGRYAEARTAFEQFLKDAPGHPNEATARFRVGETAYMLGDLDAARRALVEYTTKYTDHHHIDTAWPYLGDVNLRLGDLPAARKAYERALEASPQGPFADRARYGLARTLGALKEPAEAAKHLRELAERGGPEWKDKALYQLGTTELEAGRAAEAEAALAELERAAPNSPLRDLGRLRRGDALERLGRHDEAMALLEPLAQGEGGHAAQAVYLLAGAHLAKGEAAEALASIDAVLARVGDSAMTPLLLFRSADAAAVLGQTDEALSRYRKLAANYPKDTWADDALIRGAELALKSGNPAGARDLAGMILEPPYDGSPLRANARLIAGQAALADKKPDEAIDQLKPLLEDRSATPEVVQSARLAMGMAYRSKGQPERAAEVLRDLAMATDTASAPDAQYVIGVGHFDAGRYAEAVPPLTAYLEKRPQGEVVPDALAMLAISHQELGANDASKASLERLETDFPESKVLVPTWVRLGETALAAKDHGRAVELLKKASSKPGDDPELEGRARSGLGWALLEQEQPGEAARVFAALLEDRPEDPHAADAALALGRAYDEAGRAEEALAAYDRVAATFGESPQAPRALLAKARLLDHLGRTAREAGREEEAVDRFGQAAGMYRTYLDGKPPEGEGAEPVEEVLADLGWALLDAGRREESEPVFRRLLEEHGQSPRAADARVALAESAHHAGDAEKVEDLLGPVVAEGSQADAALVQSALFRLGLSRFDRRNWVGASEAFGRLAEGYPEGPLASKARFWKAETAYQAGDIAAAEKAFRGLLNAAGPAASGAADAEAEWRPTARLRLVESLVGLERWEEALTEADALKAETKNFPATHELEYARGRALQGLARFDEARAAYQAVIDARRADEFAARAQLMRGETFFHQEKFTEALREYLRVDFQYPDQPAWRAAALLEAGKVAERMERWADAADFYEKLVQNFAEDPHAAQAKERLGAVRPKLGRGAGRDGQNR